MKKVTATHFQVLQNAISALERQMYDLKQQHQREGCVAMIEPDLDPDDILWCEVCGHRMGWYCPTSPVKHCQYDLAEDPCMDDCIHCGQPYERK